MSIWILAVYLQILDLLTTLLFLAQGMSEGNPLVRLSLKHFGLYGLLLVKFLPLILIIAIYLVGKKYKPRWLNPVGVITKANYGYAVLMLWNLIALNINAFSRS